MRLRHPQPGPARRLRLPGRTVRARLTWVYGMLLLTSGAVLLTIVGVLWRGATEHSVIMTSPVPSRVLYLTGLAPLHARVDGPVASASWTSLPPPGSFTEVVKQRALVVGQLKTLVTEQHSSDLHQLLLYSVIALAIMAMLSIALGWLTAGRVLRPLRTITSAAQRISATSLHERLDFAGPHDELHELGDTFDRLLGRLERSFQSQRQFVANASHELRTPLATMRAELDVAVAKPEPAPPQTVLLADRLRQELDQVDRLLESFLVLARSEAGPSGDDVAIPVDALVASSLAAHASEIAALSLDLDAPARPEAPVRGNATLLARMVGNLLDNAVRHNEAHGWIHVRMEADDDTTRLVVENGGPVFDEESVQALAQPFRRLGAARTGSDNGLGLGLSIVAAIADTHGGRLELHALAGGGLQACLSLPLAPVDLSMAGAPA